MRLTVLKQVDQLYDIAVLAHLQHFDFSTLLEDLNWLHVLLFHRLDSHLLFCNFVRGQFDQPELPLAQRSSQIVVIEQVGEAHGFEQRI